MRDKMDEEPPRKKKKRSFVPDNVENGTALEPSDPDCSESSPLKKSGNDTETIKKDTSFDAHSLRKHLKGNTALQAVRLFLGAIENPDSDAVKIYIQAGGGPLELLQVISHANLKKDLVSIIPVFSVVHVVLLKILSDFPLLQKSAEEACSYLLREYTPVIHSLLAPSATVNQKLVALKLLTSVVSLSTQLARDVLNSVNLEFDSVQHLAAQVAPRDRKNIRSTFIHLILAFLVEGNSYITRQLLENKGLLRLIFQDMIFDNSTTIIFLLTALRDKVVSSIMIPKSLKLRCFNTAVLISLMDLYNWLGPSHWASKKDLTGDHKNVVFKGDEEERNAIRESLHSLLTLLCTSHKFGVVFSDTSMGAGECKNVVIRSLFTAIEDHWDDELVKDLTLNMLLSSPDLIIPAFSGLKGLFKPRPTSSWLSGVDFLYQIIEKMDLKLWLSGGNFSVQQSIKLLNGLCLPSFILQTICSEEGFQNEEFIVRGSVVKYYLTSLKKIQEYIVSSSLPIDIVKPAVFKHMQKYGPKLEWIISSWKMGAKSTNQSLTASYLDYHICFVELITILYKISPDALDSVNVCIEDLIVSSLEEASKVKEDDDVEKFNLFKLETLKMVSVLKTFNPAEESFAVCIKMLIELMATDCKKEAKVVLEKFLLSTGFMEGVEDEVEIWVNCLSVETSSDVLITLFKDIVEETNSNISHHFKTITSICDEAFSNVGDQTSTIDDLITMIQDNNEIEDKINYTAVRIQHCISPLVSAMLCLIKDKNRFKKSSENKKTISLKQKFVTAVLLHSLYRQIYPAKLYSLVQNFSTDTAASTAYNYIASWVENSDHPEALVAPFPLDSVEFKLSKCFIQQEDYVAETSKVLDLLENDGTCSPKLLLHLCIFYLTRLYERNLLTVELIENSLKVISKLISLMNPSSQGFITMLQGILSHPVMVKMFQPLKKNLYASITEVVLLFTNTANTCITDKTLLRDILQTCKNKLIRVLTKAIKKSKSLNYVNLSIVIQTFILSDEDIQNIFSQLISLPASVQEDGWLEVEALLLAQAAKNSILLSESIFSSISLRLTELRGGPDCFQQAFMDYINRFPHYIEHIESDLFTALVNEQNPSEISIQLAKLLLSSDKRLSTVFKANIVKTPSVLFPLISVFNCSTLNQKTLNKIISRSTAHLQEGIFHQYPWFVQHSDSIAAFLEKYMDKDAKTQFYQSLRSNWKDVPCQANVIQVIKSVVSGSGSEADFIGDSFSWVIESLSDNETSNRFDWLYSGILDVINSAEKNTNWSPLLKHQSCSKVMHLSLKWGLRRDTSCSVSLMKMLNGLCGALYSKDHAEEVSEFFNLVVSHSNFITVMLDTNEATYVVAQLLLTLLKMNPNLALSSHVPIYLSAYGATLSKKDQTLLEILQLYEKNGASVWEWKPCLWGPTAANYYSVHSRSVQPLWRQPRMSQVLHLLDKAIVETTIAKFPLDRSLEANIHVNIEDGENVYDIAFLLPLLSHLLAPGADVQHRSMVVAGGLAITIAAFSSSSQDVRSLAYLVLARFNSHLSSASNDQKLWLNFISVIRGGILNLESENPQVATIVTVFLARASMVLSYPQHALYSVLHNFILAKPTLHLNTIPAFLELLQSKEVQHREHQEWLLKVLRDGIRQKGDVRLLFQSFAFKILMAFYCFIHTPKNLKVLVIEIFAASVSFQDTGHLLVSNYGLCSWISHSLSCKQFTETSSLISLLEKMSYFKSHALYIKLILILLAPNVNVVNDVSCVLEILSNKKIINHIGSSDIHQIISVTEDLLGSDKVQKAKDILKYGCKYLKNVTDLNPNVTVLNRLVYDWSSVSLAN